jgi:hypothetical protein
MLHIFKYFHFINYFEQFIAIDFISILVFTYAAIDNIVNYLPSTMVYTFSSINLHIMNLRVWVRGIALLKVS